MDELLARSLQAEEAQQQQLGEQQRRVLGMVQGNEFKARSVENPRLMQRAKGLMPLEAWRTAAREEYELNRQLEPGAATSSVEDLVVKAMLKWFKQEFFSWVNNPPCATCGSSDTQHTGMSAPTAAERPHAGRVEVYNCSVCGQETRFPRYNNPEKLLESRRGRCGEWAHCFLLMLRAAGYDARHVMDNADHVWNEYWSRALGRWVHVDACETAFDTPLLYEGGWGKSLGFVLAASWHGHAEVTRRYVVPASLPQLPARRAGVSDQWLQQQLAQATTRLRAHLGQPQRRALASRDVAEMLQLMTLEGGANAAAAAAAADLPGRQSGAEAWRQARGETGSASSSRPAARPPTAFTHAADGSLAALFLSAGRLTGGACRASGEHTNCSPSQVPQRLFDGCLGTKWLDFGGGGAGGSAWVEYRLLPGQQDPVTITHYDLVAGEDCQERDPCDWVLEAAAAPSSSSSISSAGSSGEVSWVVLHECRGHRFARRHQLCSFTVPEAARMASRQWRLRISRTADPSAATCVQLACWNLYHTKQQCPQRQLLYLDSDQLQALSAAAAAAGGDGAGADVPPSSSAGAAAAQQAEGLSTLRRILGNVSQAAADPKFYKLSAKAAKLQQLLADPLLQAALFAAGFRPVLQAASAAEQEGQLSLVADDSSSSTVGAAAAALLKVLDAGAGGASGQATV